MKCLYPQTYKLIKDNYGQKRIAFNNILKPTDTYLYDITLRCNKCIFCQKYNAYHLYKKLMYEWKTNKNNTNLFITFTYANNNQTTLNKSHLQKLFKRMRKHKITFSYYAIGEYGDINYRPHYHIIFFNITNLDDLTQWTYDGIHYRSEKLNKIWKYGIVDIEQIHEMNIKYIAKHQYKTKKIKLKLYSKSLGKQYYLSQLKQIKNYNEIILNGQQEKINNYIKNQLKNYNPEIWEQLQEYNQTHKNKNQNYNLTQETINILTKEKIIQNKKNINKLQNMYII